MRTWTDEHIEYLRSNYGKLATIEIANHLGKSYPSVKTKSNKLGLRTGKIKPWTEQDIEYMTANYPTTFMKDMCEYLDRSEKSIYMQAYLMGLKKDKDFLTEWHKNNIPQAFIDNQKKKGDIPHNKGVPMSKEKYDRCRRTMFKKGHRPHNTNKEGDGAITLRNKENYKARVFNIRISAGKWVPLHRYIWEQVHGPIPKGFIVAFKNGYTDCRIENLELMSRADNMRRNSMHNYPEELREMLHIKIGFNRKLNKIIKNETN